MRIGTTSSYSCRVHARHDEADEHEGADPHMRELEQCHPVEEHAHGVNVRDVAGAVEREAGRHVHPCVDRNNGIRANNTGGEDRDERAQQGTQWHPAPAEQVDPKKNRFDKERQPLDCKRQAEHIAKPAHQRGPQQPHLKAEHNARHGAQRKEHGRHFLPSLREPERHRIVVANAMTVNDPELPDRASCEYL